MHGWIDIIRSTSYEPLPRVATGMLASIHGGMGMDLDIQVKRSCSSCYPMMYGESSTRDHLILYLSVRMMFKSILRITPGLY